MKESFILLLRTSSADFRARFSVRRITGGVRMPAGVRGAMWPFLALVTVCLGDAAEMSEPEPVKWEYSQWLGWTYVAHYPWIFRPGMGWLYDVPVDPALDAHWFYDSGLGWIYTSESIFPYLFRSGSSTWLYALPFTGVEGWYYDFAMQQYWSERKKSPVGLVRAHDCIWQSADLMETTIRALPSTQKYPIQTTANGDAWQTVGPSNWTAGFWPGMLWMMYDFTGDSVWRARAVDWNAGLASQKDNTTTHDLGFMLYSSFGQGYRIDSNFTYRDILLQAAKSLATRFSDKVGAVRSWSWGDWDRDGRFTVIVDNMMNLELLFWAAKQPGGESSWKEMAIAHADTTAREFVREDGSTYHVVIFDESTGSLREKTTHQGWNRESAWARGQAWALYGFTVSFRETELPRFLDTAESLAGFYLDEMPADSVPFWDYRSPEIPETVRDSSAAAVTASALLELSDLTPNLQRKARYFDAAERILLSLMGADYFSKETSGALLAHGTYNWPAGNRNTAVVWGDYYFLEALLRYIDTVETRWDSEGR